MDLFWTLKEKKRSVCNQDHISPRADVTHSQEEKMAPDKKTLEINISLYFAFLDHTWPSS